MMSRRWALPLAVLGGVAIGAALTLRLRHERHHHAAKHQHKQDLHAWEGEGGSLATPESAQRP